MWIECVADRPDLILPVAENMREWDKREIYATRFVDDPNLIAHEATVMGKDIGWVAGIEDRPIAAFGCFEMWPGVWTMWLFATDNFRQIRFSVTRLIIRHIVPMLWNDLGAHRLEARSMEGHHDAQGWLKVIGAKLEATHKGYGRAGEDFHVFVWERP